MVFQRLIWAALATALVVGSVQTGVQRWQAAPLILAAEVFEAQKAAPPAATDAATALHTHAEGVAPHDHGHDHGAAQEWEPENGTERLFWTWMANLLHAFSMALLVFAVMGLWLYRHGGSAASLRLGMQVAAAGWLSFHLWPALGLHAELPGMDAAPLQARQAWWVLAAASAALACALAGFVRAGWRWLPALALLALPFVIGAPQLKGDALAAFGPQVHAAMEQLASQFVWATHWVAASFWLSMGLVGGWSFQRWVRPALQAVLPPEQAALPATA